MSNTFKKQAVQYNPHSQSAYTIMHGLTLGKTASNTNCNSIISRIQERMKSVVDICESQDNSSKKKYKLVAQAQLNIMSQLSFLTTNQLSKVNLIKPPIQKIITQQSDKQSQIDQIVQNFKSADINFIISEIVTLRIEKIEMLKKLNQEIKDHNFSKTKIIHLEKQLKQFQTNFYGQKTVNPKFRGLKKVIDTQPNELYDKTLENIHKESLKSLKNGSGFSNTNHKQSKANNLSQKPIDQKYYQKSYKQNRAQGFQINQYHKQSPQRSNGNNRNSHIHQKSLQNIHTFKKQPVKKVENKYDRLFYQRSKCKINSKVTFEVDPALITYQKESKESNSSMGGPQTSLKTILDQNTKISNIRLEAQLLLADSD